MRKIVCIPDLQPEQLKRIQETVPDWTVINGDEARDIAHFREAEIVVGWNDLAADSMVPDSRLRWVQAWGAGVEQMPFDAFRRRGILLTNASGVHAYPISETVFAMMLSFARKLHLSIYNKADKKWSWTGELDEIHGKALGLVGVGAIGEEIARLARAFGMRVLGVRKSGRDSPYVDAMYDVQGLDEVLGASDYVVVTLPITPETEYMIDRSRFGKMKPTAFFINIGRGRTTDTEALIEALRNGTIAGAGLDVFEQEPLPETSPLWELPNVIVTPHNSGSSVHYGERAVKIFMENLSAYIEGNEPARNRVDLDLQY
ncbi:D-2-hydroxyacid dehydrogenase [Cohnella luojiensis]|uniref:D-2-hydroxyacid dehydrogenase n=1 Tax=Cohnella luojiensis TaxID=652876 RepID=A0A4Y8LXX5_9BACL|nr:D-2-hydroxyacid dehydrogenase [Cohnella luojiensis]TFE26280.1 D-2-hydroxyacid dehydrogenase [Cohnella luojiensis]